jgi:hypothetical protein
MEPKHSRAPATAPFFFQVYGSCDLCGPWAGWRIRGRDLITPTGERVNARRLAGLLFVEQLQAKVRTARSRAHTAGQPQAIATALILEFSRRVHTLRNAP